MHSTGTFDHTQPCDHRQTLMENHFLSFIQFLTSEQTGTMYNEHSPYYAELHVRKVWMLTEMAKVFQSDVGISDRTVQMSFQMLVRLLVDDGFASEPSPKWNIQEICYILVKTLIKQHSTPLQGLVDSLVIEKLISRFTTTNVKEREQLVYVIHAIYEEFVQLRVSIRKLIGDRFLLGQHEQRGISELLFLMGCFVGGFRVPLRDEHLEFFTHIILPLYNIGMPDTDSLDACALQFVEKDNKLAEKVVEHLINNWPESKPNSQKFFKSLARFVPYFPKTDNEFNSMHFLLFSHISKCLRIPHQAGAAVALLHDCNLVPVIASNALASNYLLYGPLYRIIIGTTDSQLAQKCTALLAQLPRTNNGEKVQALKYFSFTPSLVNSLQ